MDSGPARSAEALVFGTRIEVRSYELDSFGHVNHAVFLNYLEHGRFNALRDAGFPYESILARGWGVYVVRSEVDYVKEARLGERLQVRTWVDSFKRTSMVLAQSIVRADPEVVVVRALTTAVFVGEDRRPIRVPETVRRGLTGRPDDAADSGAPHESGTGGS